MASLPQFLFDTHKRYKADTNRVAEWLAETSQRCGLKLETQPSESRPSGRLKGKARKEARNATRPSSTASSLRHLITVKGFLDMAQFIVQQKPSIPVPSAILGLLRSAINLRRRCSNWFLNNSSREDKLRESTQKHSYFIGVLENVLQVLESNSEPSIIPQNNVSDLVGKLNLGPTSPAPAEQHDNPYDVLFLDDESVSKPASSLEPDVALQSPQTVPPPAKVTYEMETTDEEIYFGIYCFFDDLNRLREFLIDLWSRYHRGSCDLITTAVVTNSAFELIHRAEKDLAASFPKNDTFQKTAGLLYSVMCILRGEGPDHREREGDVINFKMWDVADWLFLPVHSLLQSFLPVIQAGHVPVAKPGHFGVYNPRVDRSKLSIREQFKEDMIILVESLPDFFLFTQVTRQFPVADEFLDGLRVMFTKKTVSTWVTFAAQVYLDIHHVLRQDIGRGFTELQTSGVQAISTLTEYFATSKVWTNWPSSNEERVKYIHTFADFWIVNDPVAPNLRKSGRQLPDLPTPEPHALFRRNPLLAGLFQFQLYLLLQESGIIIATAWGSILYVAHLYEACRQGGYLNRVWLDMELIMDIHTRESIFAGRVPTTPEEALKSTSLMLGASAVTFAKNTRLPKMKLSRAGPKGITPNSPVTNLLRGRYSGDANTQLTLETVEGLFEDRAVASLTTNSQIRTEPSVLRQQWTKSHKLTVLQLLETLRDATAAEQSMLRLDYFSLHQRCLAILRKLRTVLDEKFCQYFGPDWIENETQLAFIVPYIFMVASGSAKAAEELKLRDGVHSLMLKRASEVVEEFIAREGAVECQKLAKMREIQQWPGAIDGRG